MLRGKFGIMLSIEAKKRISDSGIIRVGFLHSRVLTMASTNSFIVPPAERLKTLFFASPRLPQSNNASTTSSTVLSFLTILMGSLLLL